MLLGILKDFIKSRKAPLEADVLRIARELNSASQPEQAIKLLTTFIDRKPDCVDALVLRGATERFVGRAANGVPDLTRALTLAPKNTTCLLELAYTCNLLGDKARATEYCQRAAEIDSTLVMSRWLQAEIVLGDQYYYSVLERIHAHLKPRTYLEIGVCRGESLRVVNPTTQAIGIDPTPDLEQPLAANQRLFAETSDAFFASRDLRAEFGGLPVDVAFIDGMHHFEFALRDFANVERYCTPESTVLIHDAYPLDRHTARRNGAPPFWSGDIWRLIVLLKKYRPDLAIHTIGAPPTGLALVRNLDPSSRYLADNHDRLSDEFLALDYAYLDDDKAGKLNLIPNEWDRIRPLLGKA